jgi:uncharacterized membrane protein
LVTVKFNTSRIQKLVLIIQILVLGLLGLGFVGLSIPLLKELIFTIYILFVPGILFLSLLKLNKLNNIEKILFSVGISISLMMLGGFLINLIFPLCGISKPLSAQNLNILIISLVIILFFLSLKWGKLTFNLNLEGISLNPLLFLFLMPFLAIIGTYNMNLYSNNIILILLIILLSLIPIFIAYNKFIPKKLYPLTILSVSIALLFHASLISNHLWGWDIQSEFYLANLTIKNSFWNVYISNASNDSLSVTILAPIISIFSGINLTWVFKIIYPLIFSLVPLALFTIFKNQIDDKKAVMACFIFMFFFIFYTEMLQLGKQEIAEFFLALILILLVNKVQNIKMSILLIIFSSSLIVSHYGTSYIYIMILLIAVPIFYILKYLLLKFNFHSLKSINKKFESGFVNFSYITFFIVLCIAWYMSFPGYNAFEHVVHIGNHIFDNMIALADPQSAQGMAVALEKTSFTRTIIKYLNLFVQFFIAVGLLKISYEELRGRVTNFNLKYIFLAIASFVVAVFGVVIPYFGSAINVSRLYQITLIFLAPFSIVGALTFFKIFYRLPLLKKIKNFDMKILAIFLTIFLLFNTGLVTEFTNEEPYSITLSNLNYPLFNEEEFEGAKWLMGIDDDNKTIYADNYRILLFNEFSLNGAHDISIYNNQLNDESYLFFGSLNIKEDKIISYNSSGVSHTMIYKNLSSYTAYKNEIYSNGGAETYIN